MEVVSQQLGDDMSAAWDDGAVFGVGRHREQMHAVVTGPCAYALGTILTEGKNYIIPYACDLVVGFKNASSRIVDYTLTIGDDVCERVRVYPGQRIPALWQRFPISLISLRSNVRLEFEHESDVLEVITCMLRYKLRKSLGTSRVCGRCDDKPLGFVVADGMFWLTREPLPAAAEDAVQLPTVDTASCGIARATWRLARYRRELMQVAWHPARVQAWCWDHEEVQDYRQLIIS